MKKRILIDATTITSKPDGLSQYIFSLLQHFPETAFKNFDFSILINYGIKRKELVKLLDSGKFKIVEARIAPIGPRRDFDILKFWRKNKEAYDAFHSTSNQYPLFIKNGIATIHDIIFKYYLDAPWWTFKLKQRYLNFVIKNSLRRAGSVIAVSESTKKMLNDVYKTNNKIKNKIEVIYEGWEHLINEETNAEKEGLNNQFGSYLFYVGGTRKHKNIKRLLKAFNIAKAALPEYVNLVLSGNETYLDEEDKRTIASINEKSKRVILTGYVSKTKLDNLFLHADAFIFPSLCEGFGIPVLETFYFEKPLLCSNSTSLPEIAGDAALFFDPENVKDIANKIIFFYNHPEIVADLIKKGKERLLDFSWAKAANETITLYHNHFDK